MSNIAAADQFLVRNSPVTTYHLIKCVTHMLLMQPGLYHLYLSLSPIITLSHIDNPNHHSTCGSQRHCVVRDTLQLTFSLDVSELPSTTAKKCTAVAPPWKRQKAQEMMDLTVANLNEAFFGEIFFSRFGLGIPKVPPTKPAKIGNLVDTLWRDWTRSLVKSWRNLKKTP